MSRLRNIISILLYFLASVTGIILFLFALLNMPFTHRALTSQVNAILTRSGAPVSIGNIKMIMPTTLMVTGVVYNNYMGDTIFYAGSVQTDYSPISLLRKKVVLRGAIVDTAVISLKSSQEVNPDDKQEHVSKGSAPDFPAKTNNKRSWVITLDSGDLSAITFLMENPESGINISQEVDGIRVSGFRLSLQEKEITAMSASIMGSDGLIEILPALQTSEEKTDSEWSYLISSLSLDNLNLTYRDMVRDLLAEASIGKGIINVNKLDISNRAFDIKKISLKRSDVSLHSYNDTGRVAGDNPLLQIREMELLVVDILSSGENIGAVLKSLSFDSGNGVESFKMEGRLASNEGKTELEMELETKKSRLSISGKAATSLPEILKDPTAIGNAKLSINNSGISLSDISSFYPALKSVPVFTLAGLDPINIDGSLILDEEKLVIERFSLSQDNNFILIANGEIDNCFDLSIAGGDMLIEIPEIDTEWLRKIIPGEGVTGSMPEFGRLSLSVSLSNSFRAPGFDIRLRSDMGDARVSGMVNFDSDSFRVNSVFENILAGKILKTNTLDSFYGSILAVGKGFNPDNLSANLTIMVDTLGLKEYSYTNTRIDGEIIPGNYNFEISVNDPSVRFKAEARVNRSGSVLSASASSSLRAQLNNLNLFKDTLAVETDFYADFRKENDLVDASFTSPGIKLTSPWNEIEIGSFSSSLDIDSTSTWLSGSSDSFNAMALIEMPVNELGNFLPGLSKYLNSFLHPEDPATENRTSYLPRINASLNISSDRIIKILTGDSAAGFETLDFILVNEKGAGSMSLTATGNVINYDSILIDNLIVSMIDSSGIMNLEIAGTGCSIYSKEINKLSITSNFSKWKGLTSINLFDIREDPLYSFEITSEIDSDNISFEIPSKKFILNGEEWNLDKEELLILNISSREFYSGVGLTSGNSGLKLTASKQDNTQLFNCELYGISLPSTILNEIIKGNPGGIISGSVYYSNDTEKNRRVEAGLQLSDAVWSDIRFDKISITGNYNSDNAGLYDLDATVHLDSSSISLKGEKKAGQNRIIISEFNGIPIKTFEPFVSDWLSDISGSISGSLNISSENDIEGFSGEFNILDAGMKINSLNSKYRIPGEKVLLKSKSLVFENFKLLDTINNPLMVNGSINFDDNNRVSADLEISSSMLQVLNTGAESNSPLYGKIYINSRLSLKGSLAQPVLKGRIILSEGTDVYYRNMEDLSMTESSKIVEFTDFTNPHDPKRVPGVPVQRIYNSSSIETIVEINPAAKLNFNLSKKIYNIVLMIEGGGILNFNMLSNNQLNLAGEYKINEGTAELKIVGWPNKSFRITKGGSIKWDGVLENPGLNFEAVNRVRSSYKNPVDGQQRDVDIFVTLKLLNKLSALEVLFTINTPDQYLMSIINTLSKEEQMRQAITILLFEKIDLPGISTSNDYVTEQVNQLVATQLNQLTKTTIKGVDISFGIDSYVEATQSGGEETKTSLSYDIRKAILNDRGQIEVSGRLNDVNNQPGASDASLTNLSFEYRLDSAGTKFLKVYNEQSYEDVFEGEITKTGIGFKYRKRYRKLSEIWRREKKKGKQKEEAQ